jgi:hypothetical protein
MSTIKYGAIADIHTLLITAAHTKSFQCAVFTSRSLVTASNSGYSSASAFPLLLSGEYPTAILTELNAKIVPLITPLHGPRRKHLSSVVVQSFPWEHVCLRRSYLVTAGYTCLIIICCLTADVVSLFVSRVVTQ